MHLHGHHALVLARNGVAATGSPWWVDSLNVRDDETYDIAFVADNPGIWMDHCHNLEHARGRDDRAPDVRGRDHAVPDRAERGQPAGVGRVRSAGQERGHPVGIVGGVAVHPELAAELDVVRFVDRPDIHPFP